MSAGNSITLTYKARVTGEVSKVGKIIKSEGSFYDGNKNNGVIPTGIVENKIIPKVSIEKNKYQECFDNNKSKYSGLDLINEIYKCASLEDFKFNNFDFKEIFENYVEKIKRSSNDFQTLCNVLNNVPLYIKHHNGVVDICYFGICDTIEKYRDVFYCYSFDVYIPDDCPFKKGSLFESAFRCALNGEYSMSLDVGEDEYIHYDGMLGSNKAKGM